MCLPSMFDPSLYYRGVLILTRRYTLVILAALLGPIEGVEGEVRELVNAHLVPKFIEFLLSVF